MVTMMNPGQGCGSEGCSFWANGNWTLAQNAMSAYRQWGRRNFSISHSGRGNGGECVGFIASKYANNVPWSGAILPPGSCIKAPPGKDWCNIVTPQITLDHGELLLNEAEGHSRSAQVNINCTSGTTVKLRLLNNLPYIDLKKGFRSDIFIDGKPPAVELQLQGGDNLVNISDKLTGAVNIGAFYGSSVLIMEPP